MKPGIFWALALLGYAAAAPAPSAPSATVGENRVVIGTTSAVASATAVQYLGIPFAKSPPRRFSPAEDPDWSGVLQAVETKAACIQQFDSPVEKEILDNPVGSTGGTPPLESEDCLYLNVYAPSGAPPEGGWPVMFWLYGGNLAFGDASLTWYDGSFMAAHQNVIVVTTNYRTNVFGFPGAPGLAKDEQNLGFLDQRRALAWVTDNIHAFHGDSSKVTLFGQSAGGFSVKQLLANPPSPLPFRAAIMESEGVTGLSSNSTSHWPALLNATNCVRSQPDASMDCLRAVNATQIKAIIEKGRLSFPPTVDNKTCVADIRPALAQRTLANVPIMIGSNANEQTLLATILGLTTSSNATVVSTHLTKFGIPPTAQKALAKIYPSWLSPFQFFSQIITDRVMTCVYSDLVSTASLSGYHVWRYFFNGTFANTQPYADAGAFHTAEIPLVYGTYDRQGATAEQELLSKHMQKTWADFARDPCYGPGWPMVGPGASHWVEKFGGLNAATVETIANATVDFACEAYQAGIQKGPL